MLFVVIIVLLAACAPRDSQVITGPRLVQESTREPATSVPTLMLSPTVEASQDALVTPTPVVNEVLSPLQQVTVEADFILVTPTLPPSKTPTGTPSVTPTITTTPTPSMTVTATATIPQFPTSVVVPVTAPVANPLQRVCDSTWFFAEPRPASCPLSEPVTSQGVFQSFQNGFMVWLGSQDMIYVLYNDLQQPRWETYRDPFEENMPHDSPEYREAPTPFLWQPRRGFGLLWRENDAVRERIGWGIVEFERGFSVQVQTSPDGTLFISDPDGGIFSLVPGGQSWERFTGSR